MVPSIALMVSLLLALPHWAPARQRGKRSLVPATVQQESTTIDQWVSHPTKIVLTRAQQLRLDTVRARYITERDSTSEAAKPQGEMAVILKMRDLDAKYRKVVRALLTPDQQRVFDKNVDSSFVDPHS